MVHKQYGGILEWLGRRFWESRQFYSAYIALFVAISNWITIQYKLLLENVPVLNILFSNIWVFMITATIEQALSIEENPYLYKAAPGKEKDLMIPMGILQLDALEELLRSNNALTEEKKKKFETYRQGLLTLMEGQTFGKMWS